MEEFTLYYYIFFAENLLSAIFCVFSIIVYILAKPLRIYAFKLVFWLNFFDLFRAIFQMFPSFFTTISSTACNILAVFHIFSSFNSIYWCLIITLTIYQVLALKKTDVDKYYKLWVISGIIIGIIVSVFPIFINGYYNEAGTCTFITNSLGDILKFSIIYGPAVLVTIISVALSIKSIKTAKKQMSESEEEAAVNIKRLFYYPIIMIICYLPITIARIVQIFGVTSSILLIVVTTPWGLQGFINSLAYTLTSPVRLYLKSWFCETEKFDSFSQLILFENFNSEELNYIDK